MNMSEDELLNASRHISELNPSPGVESTKHCNGKGNLNIQIGLMREW